MINAIGYMIELYPELYLDIDGENKNAFNMSPELLDIIINILENGKYNADFVKSSKEKQNNNTVKVKKEETNKSK